MVVGDKVKYNGKEWKIAKIEGDRYNLKDGCGCTSIWVDKAKLTSKVQVPLEKCLENCN